MPEAYEKYLKEHTYQAPEIAELSLYDNDSEVLDEYEIGDEVTISKIKHRETNIANIDGKLKFGGQEISVADASTMTSLKTTIQVTATTTFALSGTDMNGSSFSKERTIAFSSHAYSIVSSESSAPVKGLTQESSLEEFSENGKDFSYEIGDYIYFYVKEASRTVETTAMGQWCDVDCEALGAISITQANGVKADYEAYRVGPFIAAGHAKYRV